MLCPARGCPGVEGPPRKRFPFPSLGCSSPRRPTPAAQLARCRHEPSLPIHRAVIPSAGSRHSPFVPQRGTPRTAARTPSSVLICGTLKIEERFLGKNRLGMTALKLNLLGKRLRTKSTRNRRAGKRANPCDDAPDLFRRFLIVVVGHGAVVRSLAFVDDVEKFAVGEFGLHRGIVPVV